MQTHPTKAAKHVLKSLETQEYLLHLHFLIRKPLRGMVREAIPCIIKETRAQHKPPVNRLRLLVIRPTLILSSYTA